MLIPSTNGPLIEIDNCDYWVMKYKWYVESNGYARSEYKRKKLSLHKLIAEAMGLKGQIDHKDRNRLNCKRNNLREATNSQNQINTEIGTRNKSGYKGVRWKPKRKRWSADIGYNGRYIFIGHFYDPITAAKAYDLEARKLFGEFAVLNFPEE